jgi:predicted glycosyltransferase
VSQSDFTINGNVLIAPLDWGLGHATRCIPIIKTLLRKKCSVLLAGEGKTKALLQKEFPGLTFLHLPGYNVQYSRERWLLPFHMAGQIPKILAAIEAEQEWLQSAVKEHNIKAVISDNRYGLHHEEVHSVFITHQLLIKTGLGKLMDEILQDQNYGYINRFTECWIPDVEGEENLAGELSHPETKPEIPFHYLGPLTRFNADDHEESDQHLLIILSGPEPQRTLLEEIILSQIQDVSTPVMLVRGLPDADETIQTASHVKMFNHVTANELEQLIKDASLVISRCGYSTVMDLTTLKKKSILIPTPGQTEQEYLAKYLMKKSAAFCVDQEKFRLINVLELANNFNYSLPQISKANLLEETIDRFLLQLKSSSAPVS